MTTVRRFGNIRLAIFVDHNPPHFHILGPDCSVVVDLRTFAVVEGNREPAKIGHVLEWAKANPDTLWRLWRELNE